MSFNKSIAILICCLAIALVPTGCDEGSGPQPADVLSGSVQKGAVSAARLSIAQFRSPSSELAILTTDVDGNWAMTEPVNTSAPYVMSASGGTYDDEKTGAKVTIPSTYAMYGFIPPDGKSGQVNPLTHALYLAVSAKMSKGKSASTAIEEVLAGMTGLEFDPATDRPDKNGTDAQKKYAALLGGFSYLADDVISNDAAFDDSHRFAIVMALARDISDGYLDALDISSNAVVVDLGETSKVLPILDEDGIDRLINCANNYAQNEPSLAGIVVDPVAANIVDFRFEVFVVDANDQPLPGKRVLPLNLIPCEVTIECPVGGVSGAERTERFSRPTTTLNYSVEDTSSVNVSVYDVDGAHVKTIVEDIRQPGSYAVVWDGLDDDSTAVISGIYEFRMVAETTVTVFDSSSYGVLYVLDATRDNDRLGNTDFDGRVSTTSRKRFPFFAIDLPTLPAINLVCSQFGIISYTDSVLITVTDDPVTEYQRYTRRMRDGLNRYRLVYDSPMPLLSPGASGNAIRAREREVIGTTATWAIHPPCPSPFN